MRRIAHIVNPVAVDSSSDLYVAQPITFETMRAARDYAKEQVDVTLFSTQFPEDRCVVPTHLTPTPDLERSVLDYGAFQKKRKLPLLHDILERLHNASDAEYFVYTNVDIALMPTFYIAINHIIDQGYSAFSVTRRTISAQYTDPNHIPLMYAQVGTPHPGTDCFIFARHLYPKLFFGNACIGTWFIAKNLQLNLSCNTNTYRKFTDLHLTFHLGDDRQWSYPTLDDYKYHNEKELRRVIAYYESIRAVPDQYGFYRQLITELKKEELKRKYNRTPLRYFVSLMFSHLQQRIS